MKDQEKIVKVMLTVFALTGILALLLGIGITALHKNVIAVGPVVEGRVAELAKGHKAYVSYTYEGTTYENVRLYAWSDNWEEGDALTLRLSVQDLAHPSLVSLENLPMIITGSIGGSFLLVTLIIAFLLDPWHLRGRKLRETGMTVYAYVDRIAQDPFVTVNGAHPYILYCKTRDGREYRSGRLWEDPSELHPVGSAVMVMVSPKDPKDHLVCCTPQQYGE